MSRSFKHTPVLKYGGMGKDGKRFANKKVRKTDIGNGRNYRKLYSSYNIYDVVSNLYDCHYNDGIPCYYMSNRKMPFDLIMKYWRK